MSNAGTMLKRFIKGAARGEIDPLRVFGPRSSDIRANKAERQRRADQIEFEKNNAELKALGGSTDAPTVQIKRLRGSPALRSLSPLSPFGGPALRTAMALTELSTSKGRKRAAGSRIGPKLTKKQPRSQKRAAPIRSRGILGAKR